MALKVNSALVIVILSAIFDGPSYCQGVRLGGLRQKMEDLESKQLELEERVELLEQEFASHVQNASPTYPTSPMTTTAAPWTNDQCVVTPLHVKRETTATGYRYTVRYVPNRQDLRIVYISHTVLSSYSYEQVPFYQELVGTPDGPGGVMKVVFEKEVTQNSWFIQNPIYFMADSERLCINLSLRPDPSSTSNSTVHLTRFSVSPTQSLVYQPGQNTDPITMNYTGWDDLNPAAVFLNLDTSKVVEIGSFDYSDYFSTTHVNEYSSTVNKSVVGTVQTATYRVSGYVDITFVKYIHNSSAVESFSVTKRLEVYPSDQSGPFPEGYIDFIKTSRTKELPDGKRLYYCNVTDGNPCPIMMNVLSTEPVQVSCSELTEVASVPLSVSTPGVQGFDTYLKQYIFTIQNQTARPEPSQVECVATGDNGVGVAQRMEVAYLTQPQILTDSSSYVMHSDSVNVTCAATGFPLPSRFSVNVEESGDDYPSWHEIPANQTTVASDGTHATGTVTIHKSPDSTIVTLGCACLVVDVREDHYEYLAASSALLLS